MTVETIHDTEYITLAEAERAVAAERERCAKIASVIMSEARDRYRVSNLREPYYEGAADAADRIAAKIRSGE